MNFTIANRPDISGGRNPDSAPHILFALLVIAILANGMYFWLQKSQFLPAYAFQEYLELVLNHASEATPEEKLLAKEHRFDGLYAAPGKWLFTKLLKDVFLVAFTVFSILSLRSQTRAATSALMLPALLGAFVTASFITSMYHYGPWVALMGLRPFAYLAAGLLAVWAARQHTMKLLCAYLVAVLLIELVLGIYEYTHGLPLFHTGRSGNRITGTFVFPASLGIFSAVTYVLAATLGGINRLALLAPVAILVYLTGSATALVLVATTFAIWAVRAVPASRKPLARMTCIGIMALILLSAPKLVARYDAFDSLWGRVEAVSDYFAHPPSFTSTLFGKGLGIGSNVLKSAVAQWGRVDGPSAIDQNLARIDSTPLALINQVGIFGTIVFYLMLVSATWKDRQAAPVYTIIILAGMTINLLEIFPVNLLLGILLCRSLLLQSPVDYELGSFAVQ